MKAPSHFDTLVIIVIVLLTCFGAVQQGPACASPSAGKLDELNSLNPARHLIGVSRVGLRGVVKRYASCHRPKGYTNDSVKKWCLRNATLPIDLP